MLLTLSLTLTDDIFCQLTVINYLEETIFTDP